MLATFLENMSHATFSFILDGKTDMMSLNPLEHTNFEMMGSIFGIAGLAITFLGSRLGKKAQLPHSFAGAETDEDSLF